MTSKISEGILLLLTIFLGYDTHSVKMIIISDEKRFFGFISRMPFQFHLIPDLLQQAETLPNHNLPG